MSEHEPINFLGPTGKPLPGARHAHPWKRRLGIAIATPVIIIGTLFLLSAVAPHLPEPLGYALRSVEPFRLFKLVASANRELKGEPEDRVNVLLLGIGGEGHDGPQLTDTIIIASLKPSTRQVGLLSLPRDLVIPLENSASWRKVNSINALAEDRENGTGTEKTRSAIEQVLGISIPYVVRIDFSGFKQFIDELGGVDVMVDNKLEDPEYPIDGKENAYPIESRYEHLIVEKGQQHMDGSLALKFARSRHGYRGEGSDFARSRRQQKVLLAVKGKLFSFASLFSASRYQALYDLVAGHVQTNINSWEVVRLADIVRSADTEHIIHQVLDDSPTSLLVAGRGIDGAYILTPKGGTFERIQSMTRGIFNEQQVVAPKRSDAPAISVLNGTMVEGLATRSAQALKDQGLGVKFIANAPSRNYRTTIVYDRSNGKFSQDVEKLKHIFTAQVIKNTPSWLKEPAEALSDISKSDLIVVVGENSSSLY